MTLTAMVWCPRLQEACLCQSIGTAAAHDARRTLTGSVNQLETSNCLSPIQQCTIGPPPAVPTIGSRQCSRGHPEHARCRNLPERLAGTSGWRAESERPFRGRTSHWTCASRVPHIVYCPSRPVCATRLSSQEGQNGR